MLKYKHRWHFYENGCSNEEVQVSIDNSRWLQNDIARFICDKCGEIKEVKHK